MSAVHFEIDDAADGEVLPCYSRSGSGYVYCLSNPAMPGLVKIGFTNRSTQTRVQELSFGRKDASATGVPLPFEIVKDWQVPAEKAEEIEQHLHRLLHEFRVPAHGKWRAKEFFYLQPKDAVDAIELALKKLDWWAATQVEQSKLAEEAAAWERRRRVEAETRRKEAEREQAIKQEISDRQAQWRTEALLQKKDEGVSAGMKWGAIWFLGSWMMFGMLGAKDSIGWLCLLFGVIAFYVSKDGPGREYLTSQEAVSHLAKIAAEVRHKPETGPIYFSCPRCNTNLVIQGKPQDPVRKIQCGACKEKFTWHCLLEREADNDSDHAHLYRDAY